MENRLQTFLVHINPELSYSLQKTTLYILHCHFVCEIDILADTFKCYTFKNQEIGYYDVDIVSEIRDNVGLISSLGMEIATK